MEASKCPKCGEEPFFVEHVEKWYCYGCNEYIEDNVSERVEARRPQETAPVDEEKSTFIADELQALEHETNQTCKTCGADLEKSDDGRFYCCVCETHSEDVVSRETPSSNEAQQLLDMVAPPIAEKDAGISVVKIRQELPVVKEVAPVKMVEKKVRPIEVKMCSVCGQPLKYIEKYQRHYCYSCRKYSPKGLQAKVSAEAPRPVVNGRVCPSCDSNLKFIEKYNEWYCYTCKKYPFHKKKEAARPKELACPRCGEPLSWIEKYSRHYCRACKEYAPKGYRGGDDGGKKSCPLCNEEMKYVSEYNEWYCYRCKKYSLRPSKPVLLL